MGCGGSKPEPEEVFTPAPENKPLDPYSAEAIAARMKMRQEQEAENPRERQKTFKRGNKHKINRAGAVGSHAHGLVSSTEMHEVKQKLTAARAAKAALHAVTHPHMPHFHSRRSKGDRSSRVSISEKLSHGLHAMTFISRIKSSMHLNRSKSHGHGLRSSNSEEPGQLTKARSAPATTTDSVEA